MKGGEGGILSDTAPGDSNASDATELNTMTVAVGVRSKTQHLTDYIILQQHSGYVHTKPQETRSNFLVIYLDSDPLMRPHVVKLSLIHI